MAKWLNRAPRDPCNALTLTDLDKNRYTGVSWPDKKKSGGAIGKKQQEACNVAFSGHFGHIPHFYFAVLVTGLTSDQLQIEMSVISTRWRYKLTQRSIVRQTMWPWLQSLITRHQNMMFCILFSMYFFMNLLFIKLNLNYTKAAILCKQN